MLTNAYFDLGVFPLYESCMNKDSQFSLTPLCLIITALVLLVSTIGYDMALLRLIKIWQANRIPSSRMNDIEDRHIINEPPMRNTIINMVSLINIFSVGFLVIDDEVTNTSKYNSMFTAVLSNMVLKSPFIIFWTLRVNEETKRKDQAEERERLRQIEIQEAKMRRAQLRKKRTNEVNPEIQEVKEVNISIDAAASHGLSKTSTNIAGSDFRSNVKVAWN